MARQLEAEGEQVALLAVFDTWVLENTYSFVRFHVGYAVRRAGRVLRRARARHLFLPEVMRWLAQRHRGAREMERDVGGAGAPARTRNQLRAIYWPGKDFVAPTIAGRVTLFRVKKQPFNRLRYYDLGWGARALGGVEVHEVAGEHGLLLREPYVRDLARRLSACIARAQARENAASSLHAQAGRSASPPSRGD
jgi:thioesterase domain-containing protein